MSKFEISLSKDDLEHIANGYDIKIKINGKRFLGTNEIILKPALTNDVMAPILNYKHKCISVKDMARDTGVSQNTIHLYERGGYPSIKQIEMIAKTYDVNPAWLVGWIDDEMMPGIQVFEKVVYKESPTARLPDYFNNNNDGKIIKWKKSRRF